MLRFWSLFAVTGVLIASAARAADGPDVSQLVGKPAPTLKFTVYGGRNRIDLADLRGKMVVIDFFQCENMKDLSGFDDIADVEKGYARKGVVVIGVSSDTDPSAITATLKKKTNIDWPIDYDPSGFSGQTCVAWKESRQVGPNTYMSYFHLVYIVSPDGTVLWAGEPDQVGRALDDQLKDHPPTLVDADTVGDAATSLDKMNSALGDNNIVEAWKQRQRISADALSNDDFAAKVKDADGKLKDAGDTQLKAIDDSITNKQYADAQSKLKALQPIDDDSPLGAAIKSHIAALRRDPAAKAALAADDMLRSAQQLQNQKQTSQAYLKFTQIVRQFPGTPQADEATTAIKAIDAARPATAPAPAAAKVPPSADHGRAKSLLNLGDSYRDSGSYDKAKDKYQAVIDQFPGSDEATQAQAEIAKLPK